MLLWDSEILSVTISRPCTTLTLGCMLAAAVCFALWLFTLLQISYAYFENKSSQAQHRCLHYKNKQPPSTSYPLLCTLAKAAPSFPAHDHRALPSVFAFNRGFAKTHTLTAWPSTVVVLTDLSNSNEASNLLLTSFLIATSRLQLLI